MKSMVIIAIAFVLILAPTEIYAQYTQDVFDKASKQATIETMEKSSKVGEISESLTSYYDGVYDLKFDAIEDDKTKKYEIISAIIIKNGTISSQKIFKSLLPTLSDDYDGYVYSDGDVLLIGPCVDSGDGYYEVVAFDTNRIATGNVWCESGTISNATWILSPTDGNDEGYTQIIIPSDESKNEQTNGSGLTQDQELSNVIMVGIIAALVIAGAVFTLLFLRKAGRAVIVTRKICPECGTLIEYSSKFCRKCGRAVTKTSTISKDEKVVALLDAVWNKIHIMTGSGVFLGGLYFSNTLNAIVGIVVLCIGFVIWKSKSKTLRQVMDGIGWLLLLLITLTYAWRDYL